MRKSKVTMTAEWADENPNMSVMPEGSTHWKCVLSYKGRRMTVHFSMGPAHHKEPTAEDVLDCLFSDASSADESFEEWCGCYGYDTDSRKAELTYKAVQKQTAGLRRLLGEDYDTTVEVKDLVA